MKLHQRILLAVTLTLLLFGLAAHSLPVSLCGCTSASQEETSSSNLDICQVCQLQAGIDISPCPACLIRDDAFHVSNHLAPNPLERAISILRPPIAF